MGGFIYAYLLTDL